MAISQQFHAVLKAWPTPRLARIFDILWMLLEDALAFACNPSQCLLARVALGLKRADGSDATAGGDTSNEKEYMMQRFQCAGTNICGKGTQNASTKALLRT
eukprot:6477203-Amphidinium_carterae.1